MSKLDDAKAIVKDFDVLVMENCPTLYPPWNPLEWWNYYSSKAVWDGIKTYQENFFGKNADVGTNHVEISLCGKLVNPRPPKIILSEYASEMGDDSHYRIMRPTFFDFSRMDATLMLTALQRPTTYTDESTGKTWTGAIIGSDYQFSQIADILINGMLGYPTRGENEIFDTDGNKFVCSTTVMTIFEKFRKDISIMQGSDPYPTPTSCLTPKKFKGVLWEKDIVAHLARYGKLDTETITPAYFLNSNGAFKEVYRSY